MTNGGGVPHGKKKPETKKQRAKKPRTRKQKLWQPAGQDRNFSESRADPQTAVQPQRLTRDGVER